MSTIQTILTNLPTNAPAQSSTLSLTDYYPIAVKSAAVGGTYFGIMTLTKSGGTIKSLALSAAVVGLSAGVGTLIVPYYISFRTSYFPLASKLKSVEQRGIEILASTVGSFVLDSLVLKNTYNQSPTLTVKGVSIIAVSDLFAELITDFVFNRSLNVLD